MRLHRLSAPVAPLLTLEDAYQQLRLDPVFGTSPPSRPDDDHIRRCILAATDELDGVNGWLGRALVRQEWRMALDAFPAGTGCVTLPLPPLIDVEGVSYTDRDGVEHTMAEGVDFRITPSTEYECASIRPIYGKNWPVARQDQGSVVIDFVAGYGEPEEVPELIRQYVRAQLGFYYEHRESVVVGSGVTAQPVPYYRNSLENYRVLGVLP